MVAAYNPQVPMDKQMIRLICSQIPMPSASKQDGCGEKAFISFRFNPSSPQYSHEKVSSTIRGQRHPSVSINCAPSLRSPSRIQQEQRITKGALRRAEKGAPDYYYVQYLTVAGAQAEKKKPGESGSSSPLMI